MDKTIMNDTVNKSIVIDGYGDNLSINGKRIGDLSPSQHADIENKLGGNNYHPLENVIVSKTSTHSSLLCTLENDSNHCQQKEILDGLSCYSAVNQGQLNTDIVAAITAHLNEEKIPTVPRSIRHQYMSAFLLATTAFTKMDRVVPKVTGVEAWELSIKLARRWGYECKKIPEGKAIIIATHNNFHGRSLAAVSFSSSASARTGYGPFLPGVETVPFNDIDALKAIFEEKHHFICAFNAEPIQGEAGVIMPDDHYWPQVRELCNQYNILLVMDEVQTGYGRTGADFAHQHYGIQPDLMSCGKAAGAGLIPVSYVAGRDDIIRLLTPGSEGSTFGGYPLACVAGVYAIRSIINEQLTAQAKKKGEQMMGQLSKIKNKHPAIIKEVRGKGLLIAVEIYCNQSIDGHQLSLDLIKHGIYAKETHTNTIRFAPPLTISSDEINHITDAFDQVISQYNISLTQPND